MTNLTVPKFPMVEKIGKAPFSGVNIIAIEYGLLSFLAHRNNILLIIKTAKRNKLVNNDLVAASI